MRSTPDKATDFEKTSKPTPGPEHRRSFVIKAIALACGAIATLSPFAAGVWTYLDPLRRQSKASTFIRVVSLGSIPDDGIPRLFPIVSDRLDAWTGFPSEPIGAVYLSREKGSPQVKALSAICPHAGCFVGISAPSDCFRCPCHNSSFTLSGAMIQPSPSPREMDALDCQIDESGQVLVKWENFYTGIATKVPRA